MQSTSTIQMRSSLSNFAADANQTLQRGMKHVGNQYQNRINEQRKLNDFKEERKVGQYLLDPNRTNFFDLPQTNDRQLGPRKGGVSNNQKNTSQSIIKAKIDLTSNNSRSSFGSTSSLNKYQSIAGYQKQREQQSNIF